MAPPSKGSRFSTRTEEVWRDVTKAMENMREWTGPLSVRGAAEGSELSREIHIHASLPTNSVFKDKWLSDR